MCKTCKQCFLAGTLVEIKQGDTTSIKHIEDTKDVIVNETTEYYSISIAGETINVTGDHRVYTPDGPLPVASLIPGSLLEVENGTYYVVSSIAKIKVISPVKTYNLDLEGREILVTKLKFKFEDCTVLELV